MTADYLRGTFANSRAVIASASQVKARIAPYDLGVGNLFTDDGYGGEHHQDEYEHYSGRFHSAARVVCSKLASQPILVGRRGVLNKQKSASVMIGKGYVPPNGVPAWVGDPGEIEILTNHPLRDVLMNPNEVHTHFNFWDMACGSIMATGRSFIVALPGEDRPWDLFPIPSTWMTPNHTKGVFSEWVMKPPSSQENALIVPGDQVSHTYFADPSNPISAISPLKMAGRSVLSDEEISTTQYAEFKNGGMPKVALIAGDVMNETGFTDDPNRTSAARPVRLEPEQRRQIISWYQQQYAGSRKSGLPIVLDAIIRDLKIISRTPAEMGYLESAGLTKEQIFGEIGVSQILTGQLEGVTRASGSLAEQFFMDYCLNPIISMFSQQLTKKICPLFAVEEGDLVAWIAPGIHHDPELDAEFLKSGIRSYALQRNDVRYVLNQRFGGLPPLEGMNDVIIPEKLEERDPEEDFLGVGRMGLLIGSENAAEE